MIFFRFLNKKQTEVIVKEQEPISSREEPMISIFDAILEETSSRLSEPKKTDSDEIKELREKIASLEKELTSFREAQVKDPNWRNLFTTDKQRAYLVHLRQKMMDNSLSIIRFLKFFPGFVGRLTTMIQLNHGLICLNFAIAIPLPKQCTEKNLMSLPQILPATYLTIDPGSVGIGYAIWSKDNQYPIYTGCLECKGEYLLRLEVLINAFDFLIKDISPVHIFCEEPHYFDSHTGYKSAKREDFTKLVTSYGALYAVAVLKFCTWHPIPIAFWKGNAPKEVIHARIKRVLPEKEYKSHEADAVGIGLFLRGWK